MGGRAGRGVGKREGGREGVQEEGGREGGREGVQEEGGREGGREGRGAGGKGCVREGVEVGRKGVWEGGREGVWEGGREGV